MVRLSQSAESIEIIATKALYRNNGVYHVIRKQSLHAAYTRILRMTLNVNWKENKTNGEVTCPGISRKTTERS